MPSELNKHYSTVFETAYFHLSNSKTICEIKISFQKVKKIIVPHQQKNNYALHKKWSSRNQPRVQDLGQGQCTKNIRGHILLHPVKNQVQRYIVSCRGIEQLGGLVPVL